MNRRGRLGQIMQALRERAYTTAELAERFGVSQRTIQRDLLDIQGGVYYFPLVCQNRQEYKAMEDDAVCRKRA